MRKRSHRFRLGLEGAILAFTAALCLATPWSVAAPEPEKPLSVAQKHGNKIFQANCIVCHNEQPDDTTPFGPPNLYAVFRKQMITPAQAEQIITQGKGQMPAWKGILSKTDIKSVIAYLQAR